MSQLTFRVVAALAVTTALLLAGCSGDAPIVLPKPDPTSAPVFATDEDALAAAEVAYGEYLKASAAITKKNGEDPKSIAPFVTDDYLPELIEGFTDLRKAKRHIEGNIAFDNLQLQQYGDDLSNPATVAIYLCLDVTNARVKDAEGADVTPDRPNVVPLELTFETIDRDPELLLDSSEAWTGEDFCET